MKGALSARLYSPFLTFQAVSAISGSALAVSLMAIALYGEHEHTAFLLVPVLVLIPAIIVLTRLRLPVTMESPAALIISNIFGGPTVFVCIARERGRSVWFVSSAAQMELVRTYAKSHGIYRKTSRNQDTSRLDS